MGEAFQAKGRAEPAQEVRRAECGFDQEEFKQLLRPENTMEVGEQQETTLKGKPGPGTARNIPKKVQKPE